MTKHTIHDGVIKAMHEYDKHSADMLMSNAFYDTDTNQPEAITRFTAHTPHLNRAAL